MRKSSVLFSVLALCFLLVACGKNDTLTLNDTNIGKLAYNSVDVMGVTYDLYDNGYALIKTILHENAQLGETVTYEGNKYTVFGFVQPKVSNLQETGAFGHGNTKSPENLVLPDTIQNIPNYVLAYCSAKTIALPSSLQAMGGGVFSNCRNIEAVDFPDSLTFIGANRLFQNCTSLKSVTFPVDCEVQFFNSTFEGCTSLETATIPASADYIGGLCFYKTNASPAARIGLTCGQRAKESGAFLHTALLFIINYGGLILVYPAPAVSASWIPSGLYGAIPASGPWGSAAS